MKPASLAGIILVVVGVLSLAYQGFTYATQKKVSEIGPIEATKTEHKNIPLPPILGGIALIGGIELLATGSKEA